MIRPSFVGREEIRTSLKRPAWEATKSEEKRMFSQATPLLSNFKNKLLVCDWLSHGA